MNAVEHDADDIKENDRSQQNDRKMILFASKGASTECRQQDCGNPADAADEDPMRKFHVSQSDQIRQQILRSSRYEEKQKDNAF